MLISVFCDVSCQEMGTSKEEPEQPLPGPSAGHSGDAKVTGLGVQSFWASSGLFIRKGKWGEKHQ